MFKTDCELIGILVGWWYTIITTWLSSKHFFSLQKSSILLFGSSGGSLFISLVSSFFWYTFFSLQYTHVFCGRHLDRWPLINPTEPNPNQTKLIVNLNARDPICRVRWLSSLANNINPFLKIIFFNSKKSTKKILFTWLIPIFNRFIQIKNNNIKINMKKIIDENRLQLQ